MRFPLRSTGATLGAALLLTVIAAPGCVESGPTYVRGSQVQGLDNQAMGTGLDKHDIAKALHLNLKSLMSAPIAAEWSNSRARPTVAIYPLANETSEHIDSQLNALLSDAETFLVNSGVVTVVSVERQQQMIAEIEKQHGGGFDRRNVAAYSRQLGAKYYLTGKVFSADERTEDERRVQYFMFMQVIDVATSAVVWQNKTQLTKALIRD